MSSSWAIWNIIKHRLAGTGDGKDLLGHRVPAFANSELSPGVMCWTLREKKNKKRRLPEALSILFHSLQKREMKNPNLTNRLQVMEDESARKTWLYPHLLTKPWWGKKGWLPKDQSTFCMTTAEIRLIRTINHRGRLCLWARQGNVVSSASYAGSTYWDYRLELFGSARWRCVPSRPMPPAYANLLMK